MGTTVLLSLEAGALPCQVYVAEPEGSPVAAIVIGHEIYGLNADIRHKCDLWARTGFLAVAPDFFWRLEPGVDLDPYAPSTKDHALGLAKGSTRTPGYATYRRRWMVFARWHRQERRSA